jgi:hypothetical protein
LGVCIVLYGAGFRTLSPVRGTRALYKKAEAPEGALRTRSLSRIDRPPLSLMVSTLLSKFTESNATRGYNVTTLKTKSGWPDFVGPKETAEFCFFIYLKRKQYRQG